MRTEFSIFTWFSVMVRVPPWWDLPFHHPFTARSCARIRGAREMSGNPRIVPLFNHFRPDAKGRLPKAIHLSPSV